MLSLCSESPSLLDMDCQGRQGRTQGGGGGGGSGGSGEPPFFQINYIHSMAWHACLVCK